MNNVGEKINIEKIIKNSRYLSIKQLMAYLKVNIHRFWSWGAHAFRVDNMQEPRMFRMAVRGHHHKGHVYIFLNGMDLFDVYLTSRQGTIKEIIRDLYFDQLAEVIDTKIEKVKEYTF